MSDYDARQLWRAQLPHVPLSPAHRYLAHTLAGLVAADGIGVVSVSELVRVTGLHRATVKRAIARLIDLGWLKRRVRGGFTPVGVRLSKWQLLAPDDASFPVDNQGLKGAAGALEPGAPESSRAQAAPLTEGSRAQAAPFTGLKGATCTPSRAQDAPLPLGTRTRSEESSSSLGVSLTRGDDASRAAPALQLADPAEVEEVFQAIPAAVAPRRAVGKQDGADSARHLIAERLAAGVSVAELQEDLVAVNVKAMKILMGGGTIDSPNGHLGRGLRRTPGRVVVMPEPPAPHQPWNGIPWCGLCDEVDRTIEGPHGLLRCPDCHPLAIAHAPAF